MLYSIYSINIRFLFSLTFLVFLILPCLAQKNGQFGLRGGGTYNAALYLPENAFFGIEPALHYHAGIHYSQPLSSEINMVAGVGFRTLGYNSEKKVGLLWESEIPVELGGGGMPNDPSLPDEIQFFWQHRFIAVPIALRFQPTKYKYLYWL
ncbi:MAG: hypothetical protein AAGJ93_10825, partial [Bacteroidota bacterium]